MSRHCRLHCHHLQGLVLSIPSLYLGLPLEPAAENYWVKFALATAILLLCGVICLIGAGVCVCVCVCVFINFVLFHLYTG